MILLWQKLNKLAWLTFSLALKLLLILAILNFGVGGTVVVQSNPTISSELVHIQFLGLGHIHSNTQATSNSAIPTALAESHSQPTNPAQLTQPGLTRFTHSQFATLLTASFARASLTLQAGDASLGGLQKSITSYCLADILKALQALAWLGFLTRIHRLKLTNPFLATPPKPPQYFLLFSF